MKRAAAVPGNVHPLLAEPAESVHQLSEEGEQRVEDDPELAPGHDACAVCAGPLDNPTPCAQCESVQYCCPQHLIDDAPGHAAVCLALRFMRRADRLPELTAPKASAQPEVVAEPRGQGSAEPRRQTQAAVAQPEASVRDEAELFRPPERSHSGWQHVAPAKFLRVYPSLEARAEEEGEGQPARKRARKLTGDGGGGGRSEAGTSQGSTGQGTPQRGAAAAALGHNADAGAAADDEVGLRLAAELAERTAVLTYAFTCCHALQSVPAARGAARRAANENRPLELVVLGAAGDAELAELESWQVVGAALGQDVRILFVGPEVPEELAGTEEQRGCVTMSFRQSTYDQAAGGSQSSQPGGKPDIYFAFNPGFTCPDYEWSETVKGLTRAARASVGGRAQPAAGGGAAVRPCLVVATNTSMEAQMEAEWLEEHAWRAGGQAAPNPYTSLKLMQSGTLANDLYRKNAWLLVYECQEPRVAREARGGRPGGRRSAKAAAKRAAKALYNTLVAPVGRLLRKR